MYLNNTENLTSPAYLLNLSTKLSGILEREFSTNYGKKGNRNIDFS